MDDLISRQAAIKAVGYYCLHSGDKLLFADKPLKELPSVEPVRRGRWMHDEDDFICAGHCSCCGWMAVIMETDVAGMPYCPNRGAKMEG